jgi:hypothetical protein
MSTTSPAAVDEGAAQWARAVWTAAEPMTLSAYFTPEAAAVVTAAGLDGRSALVVLRAAPLGDAAPAVAAAAFRGFPYPLITGVLQRSRPVLPAEDAVRGMHDAVALAAARQQPDLVEDPRVLAVAEDLEAAVADLDTTGRPLAAGGQAITAPDSTLAPVHPWARLWRAANTLREHRGDGHIAALTAADLPRVQAEVLTAAWAGTDLDVAGLRSTRSLDDDTWAQASNALVRRGLLTSDGTTLTPRGRQLREGIERATDAASAAPWAALGRERTQAAWDLLAEASSRLIASDQMVGTTPVGSPWPAIPLAPAA